MLYVVSDTEREFEINGNIKINFVFSLAGNLTSYGMSHTMMVYFYSIEFISIYTVRIKAEDSSELVYTVDFTWWNTFPWIKNHWKVVVVIWTRSYFFQGISSSLIESIRKILMSSLWFGLFWIAYSVTSTKKHKKIFFTENFHFFGPIFEGRDTFKGMKQVTRGWRVVWNCSLAPGLQF